MSDTQNNTQDTSQEPAAQAVDTSGWDTFVSGVTGFINAISPLIPVVEGAIPAIGPGVALGVQIVRGLLGASPVAEELYKQIVGGTPPTPEQLKAFQSSYEADDDQLAADIEAQLAKLG